MRPDEAAQALDRYTRLVIRMVEPTPIISDALAFTQLHGLRAVYDSIYVVLARQLGADLWTADTRLLNALGGAAPWVRWIGAYPLIV